MAIFMPGGAFSNTEARRPASGFSLSTTLWPPTRLPLPGNTWIVVTPPATARRIAGSSKLNESSARTCAVIGVVISLPSALASTEGHE